MPETEISFNLKITPRVFPLDWSHEIPFRGVNRLRPRIRLGEVVETVSPMAVFSRRRVIHY